MSRFVTPRFFYYYLYYYYTTNENECFSSSSSSVNNWWFEENRRLVRGPQAAPRLGVAILPLEGPPGAPLVRPRPLSVVNVQNLHRPKDQTAPILLLLLRRRCNRPLLVLLHPH